MSRVGILEAGSMLAPVVTGTRTLDSNELADIATVSLDRASMTTQAR
jgi:hypothetical protein